MELLKQVFQYLNYLLLIIVFVMLVILLIKLSKLSKSMNTTNSKLNKINDELVLMEEKMVRLDNKAEQMLPELITTYGVLELIIAILKDRRRTRKQKGTILSSVVRVAMNNPNNFVQAVQSIKKI